MEISIAGLSDRDAWNAYVEQHPSGSFFHLFDWSEVVHTVYGYRPLYLVARRGGDIAGLAPLIEVRSLLLGRSLVSTAFTVGGGPIGDDDAVVEALAKAAVEIGKEKNVQHIEFRNQNALHLDDWVIKPETHAGFHLPIIKNESACLEAIPRKRRADLRKALAAATAGDLKIRIETDIDTFHGLYACSLRRLGTPVMPKAFLQEIVRAFGDAVEISFVDYYGTTVAGLLSFYFGDVVSPYYVGATSEARACHAHDLLYWSLMRRAATRGALTFDFGRSKIDSGPYRYKLSWGAGLKHLPYQYRLIKASKAPDVNASNLKFRYFSKAWTKLPLPATNVLGPLLAPNFP